MSALPHTPETLYSGAEVTPQNLNLLSQFTLYQYQVEPELTRSKLMSSEFDRNADSYDVERNKEFYNSFLAGE